MSETVNQVPIVGCVTEQILCLDYILGEEKTL